MDDGGYIHMDIIADFIVFQPQKGQKLLVRFIVSSLMLILLPNCQEILDASLPLAESTEICVRNNKECLKSQNPWGWSGKLNLSD